MRCGVRGLSFSEELVSASAHDDVACFGYLLELPFGLLTHGLALCSDAVRVIVECEASVGLLHIGVGGIGWDAERSVCLLECDVDVGLPCSFLLLIVTAGIGPAPAPCGLSTRASEYDVEEESDDKAPEEAFAADDDIADEGEQPFITEQTAHER